MNASLIQILVPGGAFVLGGVIGFTFGTIQNVALARHRKKQDLGQLPSGWALIPGSMSRTAMLLVALVAVQLACPMFFESAAIQWVVSAGVVVGYGWTLFKKFSVRTTADV